jgi:pimeloyl-ACP methyl ester carboxylesterase
VTWSRLLRRDVPFVLGLSIGAALLLAWNAARTLGAPMPWWSVARFATVLAVLIVVLRLAHAALRLLARRCVPRRRLAIVLADVATVALGFPHAYVALQTHRIAVPQTPAVDPALGAEEVAFATSDGVALRGTLLAQPRPAPLAIVCHGVGANRAAFFGHAQHAFALGCHVLAFDFRAHGDSGGFASTFGADEVLDVAAAAAWLRARPGCEASPLVLIGVSMGGATVLRAAAETHANGVLAESAFADLDAMIERQAAVLGPLAPLAVTAVAWAAWWQLGVDVAAVSPRRSLASLPAAVPVVLVHAGDDDVIPVDDGRRLAAARPGTALHVVDGATHGACITTDPQGLRRLLADLIAEVVRTHGGSTRRSG